VTNFFELAVYTLNGIRGINLGITAGSKLPSLSLGISSLTSPRLVFTFFWLYPVL
jgi:hypothetical protein